MTILACDLDNTLIYSSKRALRAPHYCVEIYRGEPITYMTDATAGLLKKAAAAALFVPVTTRTVEQYQRISFPIRPPYALVCNGGILLKGEAEVAGWYEESRRLAQIAHGQLKRAEELLCADSHRSFELRRVRDLFLFTKSDNPGATVAYLTERIDMDRVEVCANGSKIYVMPAGLTKGRAIRRLRQYLQGGGKEIGAVIAAGDSIFDVSMLKEADIGYAPEELAAFCDLPQTVHILDGADGVFSDEMLRRITQIVYKHKR